GLEKQGLAIHVDIHSDNFPTRPVNLSLLHVEGATLVEPTQNTPAEGYVLKKMSINLHKAFLERINGQGAFHSPVNRSFAIGRIEVRVRVKVEADEIPLTPDLFIEEGLRQNA